MQTEWPAWRLIMDGVATLEELSGERASYSLADCYKANAVLDMRADIERQQRESRKQ